MYILITEASRGLGKEMVHKCAAKGMNILLVSLPKEDVGEMSQAVMIKYGVMTDFLEIDLTKIDEPEQVFL